MNNLNLPYPIQIFVFGSDITLGTEITKLLEIEPSLFMIKKFENGERIPHQTETVRGRDVYIIFTNSNGPEMDSWMIDCLRFIYAIKSGQPHKITVIIPKLPHQRQDEENRELREPKLSDLFPKLLKTAGVNAMVVCKLHNPASCTTDPPMDNLHTTWIIVKEIEERFNLTSIAIAAADMGGSKYARKIAGKLSSPVPLIIVDKDRNKSTGETKSMNVFSEGEISEKIHTVIFVDDLISTFGSLLQASEALALKFPNIVNYFAMVTHPDFCDETADNIIKSKFLEICVMNTTPIDKNFVAKLKQHNKKIKILSVAKLIAQTIDNLHNGASVSALWTKNGN